jgi:hypothetical protein
MFWNQQPKQSQTSDFRRRNLNAPASLLRTCGCARRPAWLSSVI